MADEDPSSLALKFWVCFIVGLVIVLSLFRGFASPEAEKPPTSSPGQPKKPRHTGAKKKRKSRPHPRETPTTPLINQQPGEKLKEN